MLQAERRGARTQMLRPAGSAVSRADGQHTCGSEAREGPPGGQACVTRCPGGRGSSAAAELSLPCARQLVPVQGLGPRAV